MVQIQCDQICGNSIEKRHFKAKTELVTFSQIMGIFSPISGHIESNYA